jgi:predicted nucleic acid-binding protein
LDSSVLVRSVADERRPAINALWHEWLRYKVILHAPALMRYEVVNALYQLRKAGRLTGSATSSALRDALRRPVVLHEDNELHELALELAAKHRLPAAYDAQYLALAQRLGVELWTTDAKLVKAVQDHLAWVKLVS